MRSLRRANQSCVPEEERFSETIFSRWSKEKFNIKKNLCFLIFPAQIEKVSPRHINGFFFHTLGDDWRLAS